MLSPQRLKPFKTALANFPFFAFKSYFIKLLCWLFTVLAQLIELVFFERNFKHLQANATKIPIFVIPHYSCQVSKAIAFVTVSNFSHRIIISYEYL